MPPRSTLASAALGGALLLVAILIATLAAACEPSALPSGAEGGGAERSRAAAAGDSSPAQQRSAAERREAVQRADSLADRLAERLAARVDSAFASIEPLSAGEKQRLRRYLQDAHMARARRLGVGPVPDRRAAAALMASNAGTNAGTNAGSVARLRTNDFYIVDPRMGYAVPLATQSVKHLLARIGRDFQQNLTARGLPPYRFILTNVLRTGQDQAALQGVNVNAARGQSTHQYGTTFDVYYERYHYAAARDTLARRAAGRLLKGRPASRLDRVRFRQHLRRAYRRFGRARAEKIKAVLGRTLLQMQEEGLLLSIYERQQSVFHLTTAREVEAPAAGAARPPRAAEDAMPAALRRFYADTESQLADAGNDLDDLEEEAARASGKVGEGLEQALAALRGEQGRLWKMLHRLVGASSAEEAQSLKADLREGEAALEARIERARISAMPSAQDVRSHLRPRLREMDREISWLEGQVEHVGLEEEGLRRQVTGLRRQVEALKRQRDALRGASGRAFRDARSSIADQAARLSTALQTTSAAVADAAWREEKGEA